MTHWGHISNRNIQAAHVRQTCAGNATSSRSLARRCHEEYKQCWISNIFGLANRSRYQNIRTEAARFASGANINLWSWEPTSQQAAAPHNAETGANISGMNAAPIKPTLLLWVFERKITIPSGRIAPTNAQYEISAAATESEGGISNFFFCCRCRCRCLPCRKILSGSKTKQ